MKMKTYMLFDTSASMWNLWDEMNSAISEFVSKIKKGPFYLAAFSGLGYMNYDVIHNGKRSLWDDKKLSTMRPTGSTPLFDAFGRMFDQIMEDQPKKAQVVIITDGAENASKEWRTSTVKAAIKRLEDLGYDVIFMGATFEGAYHMAGQMGISPAKTVNMRRADTFSATVDTIATRSAAYAAGQTMGTDALDDEVREAAGEKE